MKTKLLFNRMLIILVVMAGIFISSCTKEDDMVAPEPESSLKIAQLNDMYCELIGGQTIPVGTVVYSLGEVDGVPSILVTYTTSGTWLLYELHLYVGNLAGLPTKNSALQIGHFPYAVENLNGVTTHTIPVPLAGLTKDAAGYTIAAHAVVKNGTQEETAWANCSYRPVITLKAYLTGQVSGEPYVLTDGTSFSDDYYCDDMGLNYYVKGAEYLLQNPNRTPSVAGKVTVTDDGTNMTIRVIPDTGTLTDTRLFVGSLAELEALPSYFGNCPDLDAYPYKEFADLSEHVFVIPLPTNISNSVSFESINDRMRWGWYSVVNF